MSVNVDISLLRTNGGTQSRAAINHDVVADYADLVKAGTEFPPVIVFHDGNDYWLADGFHRYEAYVQAGMNEIPTDIRQGTQRDAVLFSVGANASHGLRRTNDDKRRAVMVLLNDPEWSGWSQAKIALACGVSREYVSRLSRDLSCDRSQDSIRTVTRNGTTYQQNTANIGAAQKAVPSTEPEVVKVAPDPVKTEPAPENNAPDAASEPAPAPDEAPDDDDGSAKLRRDFLKLTPEAQEDEFVGLHLDLDEARQEIERLKAENERLKAQWMASVEGSNMGRVLGLAERRATTAEGRASEHLATAKRLEYRVKVLEKEKTELQRQLENQIIPMS